MNKPDLKIGGWWAPCCIQDLNHIKDEADLAEAREVFADKETGATYWPTLKEALGALDDVQNTEFERGMAYALRRYFNLPR